MSRANYPSSILDGPVTLWMVIDEQRGFKMRSHDIPLRALIAKGVYGLMMAGRCISGDFITHSSCRVTAALSKRMPHDIMWKESEAKLTQMGLRA